MLEEYVAAHLGDAFARYGLALECVKSGEHDAAVRHFEELIAQHPNYVAAYFHYGQLLAGLQRTDEAKRILSTGIVVAQKAGDTHARDEMQAALAELKSAAL